LASYLGDHPEIVAPKNKEPNFFSTDLPLQEVEDLDSYLELFEKESAKERISFEASTWYLYSDKAVDNILDFNPDSKLIVLIRNPVEMVQSLHSQQLYNLTETITDFEEAWYEQLTEARRDKWLLQYKTCCKTGTQLERLVSRVYEPHLKLIVFDDLKENPERVFFDVQKFIGVGEYRLSDYSAKNTNKEIRLRGLQEFVKNTPKPIVRILNAVKRLLRIKHIGLFDRVSELNKVEKTRKNISANFRSVLVEEFSGEIEKIERILGRDLTHWKR